MVLDRNLDPTYVRGSSATERKVDRQYIHLSKEDVAAYLERTKIEPYLSLNDFTKQQVLKGKLSLQTQYNKSITINPQAQLVADCEGFDLSGLNFSIAKINGVNFAGAKLEGCKFDKADINRSSLEGANIKSASFVETNTLNANFFSSNISDATIVNSNFSGMAVRIIDSNFNNTNLEGISLVSAYMKSVEAQHAILNNTILQNSQIISSNFKDSLMQRVQATNAKFEETILENVKAPFANFEKVKFDSLTSLEGADLENAILNYVETEKVNFKNANLKFADLEGAVLEKAKANKLDMTGCNLHAVSAKEAIFTDAVMKSINASQANLEKAVCENADL